MRTNILHPGADELSYEIREIVAVAKEFEKRGVSIAWENIGDPVEKGGGVPLWIKEIIQETIRDDSAFAYSPTKGLLEAREFISGMRRRESGVALDPEDILFSTDWGMPFPLCTRISITRRA